MTCKSPKEILCEIRRIMGLRNINMKDLSILTGKSQQSISQIFTNQNPNCKTLCEICNALDIKIDIGG